jgi:hypothetical protein
MAQAVWHSSTSRRHAHGSWLRQFKLPSEESAAIIAIAAVVVAVVILHQRDAVRPRPETGPGVSIETAALTPVEVPLAEPRSDVPVVPPPPAPQASLRNVDFAALPAGRNLAQQTGAGFDPALVSYGGLTGAGEVALAPLQSGGSAGTIAIAVIGNGRIGPYVLTLLAPDGATRNRIRAGLEHGELVVTTAVLGDEDPLCCPSSTKRSYYTWDGEQLHLQREVTTTNVSAKD